MPSSRFLSRSGLKKLIFDALKMQQLIDARRRKLLEDSMGFRGQWQPHREFQIKILKEFGLMPSHRLLEIGCGPMTGGIPIIQYLDPNRYVGIDVRSSVLDLAWQEVGAAGLSLRNAKLIHSLDFAHSELRGEMFDFIFSFSVLFHLDDERLDHFFAMVRERLHPDGKCIANINTEASDDRWLEFPFVRRSVETYQQIALRRGLSLIDHGKIDSLGFEGHGLERRNRLLVFKRGAESR
jgi:2-polyprenyl-3-methyl-5-hydroxy-6-metoxy-1,4-benzoquinol methylase